jgi:hypothetical protein
MSPRWNWDSPTPLAASECAPPPGPKGGKAHSPAAKGVGGVPIPTTGETLSTLPILCFAPTASNHVVYVLMYQVQLSLCEAPKLF